MLGGFKAPSGLEFLERAISVVSPLYPLGKFGLARHGEADWWVHLQVLAGVLRKHDMLR